MLEVKVCEEIKETWKWNTLVHGFIMLQFLILISYVTGPNLWVRCNKRVCALELDGSWGGNQSLEVLKYGSFTWLSLRWFQLVALKMKKFTLFP